MISIFRAATCSLLVGLFASNASAGDIRKLVVFGDSYSSTGNLYVMTGGGWPAPPMYPFDGRWSNGPIWIDLLADLLVIEAPQPSLAGGTNYAWAGAVTSFEPIPGFLPPIGAQVLQYLGDVGGVINRDDHELHVISGGALDYMMLGNPDYHNAAKNIADAAGMLANAGAKRVMVTTTNAGELVPDVLTGGGSFNPLGLISAEVFEFVEGFNAELTEELRRVQCENPDTFIYRLDLAAVMRDMVANAADYGFVNTTDAAVFAAGNPDQFVFWDTAHMTSAAHQVVAGVAAEALSATPWQRRIQRGQCQ